MEHLIQITQCRSHGMLPDPFLRPDGTRIAHPEDWSQHREDLLHLAVDIPFGQQPPKPDFLHIEPLCLGSRTKSYRLTSGPYGSPVSFRMLVLYPQDRPAPWPVVIDGDLCWDYPLDKAFLGEFLSRGIAVALFDRTEIASDVRDTGRRSPLYRAYPDLDFGALMGWAWGYSRCVDALLELGLADPNCIAFTGHSRGGKAALLAGVLDTRATIVNPNNSGCGGAGCFRTEASGLTEDAEPDRNENLEDIIDQFDYWFSKGLQAYYGKAGTLPFDQHYLKALVAPRILLEGNAASDLWANPVGSWQTACAAHEVFRFLGAPENHYWYYRKGYHWHKVEDVARLAKIMRCTADGTRTDDRFYEVPFAPQEPMFTWTAP